MTVHVVPAAIWKSAVVVIVELFGTNEPVEIHIPVVHVRANPPVSKVQSILIYPRVIEAFPKVVVPTLSNHWRPPRVKVVGVSQVSPEYVNASEPVGATRVPALANRFAFISSVYAVAAPKTPPPFIVTVPLNTHVLVKGVYVPVMEVAPVTVIDQVKAGPEREPEDIVNAPAIITGPPTNVASHVNAPVVVVTLYRVVA